MTKVAVVQYPGSNCDRDVWEVLQKVEKTKTDLVWHKELKKDEYDAYVLPGGFSYGDYLRAGAIAAASPSLAVVREAADKNKPILGTCNGFQILVEAGLLPGAILRNNGLRFVCTWTRLRVETSRTPFTSLSHKGDTLRIPIAHGEGRYYIDKDRIPGLEEKDQIVLRYVDEKNEITEDSNPNGSIDNIAGVCNEKGNVMGLMPHPERASIRDLSPDGQTYGRVMFDSMLDSLKSLRD